MAWGKLNNDDMVRSQIATIASQLQSNSIESMFLIPSFVPVTSESAAIIGKALINNKSLTELYLAGHNIGIEGCKSLGSAMKVHSGLKKVSLGHAEIGSDYEQLRCMLTAIFSSKSIDHVDLSKRSLDERGMEILDECFGDNNTLTSLDLCQNALDDAALAVLARVIQRSNIHSLNIAYNTFGGPGMTAFVDTLLLAGDDDGAEEPAEAPVLALQRLNVTSNALGESGSASLARLIASNGGLREVEMNDCGVTGEGSHALGYALIAWNGRLFSADDNPGMGKALPCSFIEARPPLLGDIAASLNHLVLRGGFIEDEGVCAIVEAYFRGRLPSLTLLDVANNKLTHRSLSMLGGVVQIEGATLEILDVSCNDFGNEGTELLGGWITGGRLERLRCLSINNIGIGTSGMLSICKYLTTNPSCTIKVIEAMGNQKSGESDTLFLEALDDLYDETEVDFKWK
eukprot:gene9795-11442_t